MAEIPASFDDFMEEEESFSKPENKKLSAEETFEKERIEWTEKIRTMTKRMKNVMELQDLMVDVYSERQRGVEYYHYLMSLLININKNYRRKFSEKFKYYTDQIQIRVNKDQINNLVQSDLENIVEIRERLENHAKFMNNTVSTIDNIIYGIKYRIEIEQIKRGK